MWSGMEGTQSAHLLPSLYSCEAVLRRWVRQPSTGQVSPDRSNREEDRRGKEVDKRIQQDIRD